MILIFWQATGKSPWEFSWEWSLGMVQGNGHLDWSLGMFPENGPWEWSLRMVPGNGP